MVKLSRYSLTVIFIVALLVFVLLKFGFDYYIEGGFKQKQNINELADALYKTAEIVFPKGSDGPFPVILMFHGCGGKFTHQSFWSEKFASFGFASIIFDSYAFRENVSKRDVCQLKEFFGSERAVDVIAALDRLKNIEGVDPDNVILAGWSHGAWTVMDAVSMMYHQRQTPLLSENVNFDLSPIKGTLLFYPYCGYDSKFARFDWPRQFSSLMILAGKDTLFSHEECVGVVNGQQLDKVMDVRIIDFAEHAFDYPPGLEKYHLKHDPKATDLAIKYVERYLTSLR